MLVSIRIALSVGKCREYIRRIATNQWVKGLEISGMSRHLRSLSDEEALLDLCELDEALVLLREKTTFGNSRRGITVGTTVLVSWNMGRWF